VLRNKIPPPLAKSGIDKLKECTNLFGPNFTTKEDETATPPRVGAKEDATLQRVERKDKHNNEAWQRTDQKAKCFLTTLSQGPKWSTISRRMTRRLDTMECIEDIDVDATLSDAYLHRRLPDGIVGTQTTLYHKDKWLQNKGKHTSGINKLRVR
jgi:hypothetical protein